MTAPAAPRIAGVDDRGLADASGVVPQNTAQRPAGWKSWQGRLSSPAFGCSAGEKVLVCRTTDGRYEALDPASGKKLWDVPRAPDTPAETYISAKGFPFAAGSATRPTVHDGSVVLVAGGSLQVRDARTGAVRWEKPAVGPQGFWATRPVVADGIVFAATEVEEDVNWVRAALTAFSLADGRQLWSKELTNGVISFAERRGYEPVAHAKGIVYALSQGGLVAYEGRKGTQLGQADPDAKECHDLKVFGTSAYCVGTGSRVGDETTLHLLDAGTLASKASLPGALGGTVPTAVGARSVVSFDKGLRILDPSTGKLLASYPVEGAPAGLDQAWSSPLLMRRPGRLRRLLLALQRAARCRRQGRCAAGDAGAGRARAAGEGGGLRHLVRLHDQQADPGAGGAAGGRHRVHRLRQGCRRLRRTAQVTAAPE